MSHFIDTTTYNSQGQALVNEPESPPENASSSKVKGLFHKHLAKAKESIYIHTKNDSNQSYINENPYIPGTLSIVTAPLDLFYLIKDFICAKINHDASAQLDISMRIAILPIGVGYRVASCFISLVEFLSFFHPFERSLHTFGTSLLAVAKIVNIAAFALWALEFAFESVGFYRNASFYKQLNAADPHGIDLKKSIAFLKNNFMEITDAEKQHLKNSEERTKLKTIKQARLVHRIRPWAVNKLEEGLINLNLDTKEGQRTAEDLLKMVKTQTHKKLLINVLGVSGALLGLISISLTLLAVPGLVPIVAFTLFSVLTTARYLVTAGMLEHNGWSFSVAECTPNFIKTIGKKIKSSAERGLAHLQDYLKEQKHLEIKGR